jgi:hypothetical protein
MLPINLTFGQRQLFLDRIGGVDIYSDSTLLTLPLALFSSLPIGLVFLKSVFSDPASLVWLIVVLFRIALCYNQTSTIDVWLLKDSMLSLVFVSSYVGFCELFRSLSLSRDTVFRVIRDVSILVLSISIISDSLLAPHSFLFSGIRIYDFEQFFAFPLIPVLFLILPPFCCRLMYTVLLFILINRSANLTALISMLVTQVTLLLPRAFSCVLFIRSRAFYPVAFAILVAGFTQSFYVGYLTDYVSLPSHYMDRLKQWVHFFHSVGGDMMLLPSYKDSGSLESDMNNEYIELYRSFGPFFLVYYFILFARLRASMSNHLLFGLALFLTITISDFTVGLTLHLYTSLCLSLLIAAAGYLETPSEDESLSG